MALTTGRSGDTGSRDVRGFHSGHGDVIAVDSLGQEKLGLGGTVSEAEPSRGLPRGNVPIEVELCRRRQTMC